MSAASATDVAADATGTAGAAGAMSATGATGAAGPAGPAGPAGAAGASDGAECKGCRATVRLAAGEVERILADYFRGQAYETVDDATYAARLRVCGDCPDLRYGTTCRHCGCLVAVRAKLAKKSCPAPAERWR